MTGLLVASFFLKCTFLVSSWHAHMPFTLLLQPRPNQTSFYLNHSHKTQPLAAAFPDAYGPKVGLQAPSCTNHAGPGRNTMPCTGSFSLLPGLNLEGASRRTALFTSVRVSARIIIVPGVQDSDLFATQVWHPDPRIHACSFIKCILQTPTANKQHAWNLNQQAITTGNLYLAAHRGVTRVHHLEGASRHTVQLFLRWLSEHITLPDLCNFVTPVTKAGYRDHDLHTCWFVASSLQVPTVLEHHAWSLRQPATTRSSLCLTANTGAHHILHLRLEVASRPLAVLFPARLFQRTVVSQEIQNSSASRLAATLSSVRLPARRIPFPGIWDSDLLAIKAGRLASHLPACSFRECFSQEPAVNKHHAWSLHLHAITRSSFHLAAHTGVSRVHRLEGASGHTVQLCLRWLSKHVVTLPGIYIVEIPATKAGHREDLRPYLVVACALQAPTDLENHAWSLHQPATTNSGWSLTAHIGANHTVHLHLEVASRPVAILLPAGSFKHAVVLLGIARSGTSYQREPSYTCGLSPNLEAMAIDENHAHRAQAQHQHNSCIPANLDPTPWPSLLDGPGRIAKLRPSPQRIIASVTLVQPQASCPDIIYVAGCQTPVFWHFPPRHSQPQNGGVAKPLISAYLECIGGIGLLCHRYVLSWDRWPPVTSVGTLHCRPHLQATPFRSPQPAVNRICLSPTCAVQALAVGNDHPWAAGYPSWPDPRRAKLSAARIGTPYYRQVPREAASAMHQPMLHVERNNETLLACLEPVVHAAVYASIMVCRELGCRQLHMFLHRSCSSTSRNRPVRLSFSGALTRAILCPIVRHIVCRLPLALAMTKWTSSRHKSQKQRVKEARRPSRHERLGIPKPPPRHTAHLSPTPTPHPIPPPLLFPGTCRTRQPPPPPPPPNRDLGADTAKTRHHTTTTRDRRPRTPPPARRGRAPSARTQHQPPPAPTTTTTARRPDAVAITTTPLRSAQPLADVDDTATEYSSDSSDDSSDHATLTPLPREASRPCPARPPTKPASLHRLMHPPTHPGAHRMDQPCTQSLRINHGHYPRKALAVKRLLFTLLCVLIWHLYCRTTAFFGCFLSSFAWHVWPCRPVGQWSVTRVIPGAYRRRWRRLKSGLGCALGACHSYHRPRRPHLRASTRRGCPCHQSAPGRQGSISP